MALLPNLRKVSSWILQIAIQITNNLSRITDCTTANSGSFKIPNFFTYFEWCKCAKKNISLASYIISVWGQISLTSRIVWERVYQLWRGGAAFAQHACLNNRFKSSFMLHIVIPSRSHCKWNKNISSFFANMSFPLKIDFFPALSKCFSATIETSYSASAQKSFFFENIISITFNFFLLLYCYFVKVPTQLKPL